MDSLPTEIVEQIITNIPKSSLPSCRLVCHAFNTVAFPIVFGHVTNWLDYALSHRAVISLVHDVFNRPAVMWSPWATGPDGPVDDVWLGIAWKLLMKRDIPTLEGEGGVKLTAGNFAELSGMEDMTENRLRTGQNRFLLHRSYADKFDWSGVKL